MKSLERTLRPPEVAHPAGRDALALALLAALAVALAPRVAADGGLIGAPASEALPARLLDALVAPMLSPLLLPALGLLLALRVGAIDLSVWIATCLGGVVAAALIGAGLGPALALPLAVLAGAALGAANGVFVAGLRLPAPAVTLAMAVAVMLVLGAWTGPGRLTVPDDAFAAWHLPQPAVRTENGEAAATVRPLAHTRMFAVAVLYGLTMLALVEGQVFARRGWRLGERRRLVLALAASGALSAAGGALWLLDYGSAPVLARPVGDLRIAAAAVLAGGLYFSGRGRSLVAGLCLPPALLLAGAWRMGVWDLPWRGYYLQLLLLVAGTLAAHAALARLHATRTPSAPSKPSQPAPSGPPAEQRTPRLLTILAAIGTAGGLLLLATADIADAPALRQTLHVHALAIGCAGLALLIASLVLARRRPAQL